MRIWLFGAAALAAFSCSTLKTYKIDRVEFPNKSGTLDNGLRVVVQPEPSLPYAVVTLRYDVGAAHDPADRKGLAHLIEHLAFRLDDAIVEAPAGRKPEAPKSEAAPGKPVRRVNYLVSENAYTTLDETVYWKEVVPYHLDDVLKSFAEQMGDFSKRITQDVFETERSVVRNERRSSYETRPLNRWVLDLYRTLFPAGHPYRGDRVIGSHETISAIELSDLSAFLTKHYHPANATLVISGPVSADATLAKVIELFGAKPKLPASKLSTPSWTPAGRRERIVVAEAKETMVTIAWPAPPRGSDEAKALQLLSDNGWFWYRLVHNRGWAYWAYSTVIDEELESLFVVQALLKDHGHVEEAVDKILEIAELLPGTTDDESIGQSRRRRIYRELYEAEAPRDRSDTIAAQFAHDGKPMSWVQRFDAMLALEPGRVREVGRRVLDADRALVLIHTPVKEAAAAAAEAPAAADYQKGEAEKLASGSLDHEERDLPPRVYDFTQPFADFRQWAGLSAAAWEKVPEVTLSNGMRCRIVQNGSLPIMYVRALFAGGEMAQAADKSGTAYLTVNTMGLAGRADRMREYLMGLYSYYDIDDEYLALSRKFLSFYAADGLALFGQNLASPKFLAKDLGDERDAYLQFLGDSERDVDSLASRAFWKARGLEQLSPVSTKSGVARIALGDVEAYHERVFYPENALVAVASNLPVNEVRAMLEAELGSWSATGRAPLSVKELAPQKPAARTEGLVVVSVPGSSQTKIMLGFDTSGWRDWRAMLMADAVAKLIDQRTDRLREAMGVTYGTSVTNSNWESHGLLALSTKVERDATDRALKTLLLVIERLRVEPVDEQQLDYVRRAIIDDYTTSDFTASTTVSRHVGQMRRGRPLTFNRDVVELVSALSRDELQKAIDSILAQKPTIVIAGKDPAVPELGGQAQRYTAAELLD